MLRLNLTGWEHDKHVRRRASCTAAESLLVTSGALNPGICRCRYKGTRDRGTGAAAAARWPAACLGITTVALTLMSPAASAKIPIRISLAAQMEMQCFGKAHSYNVESSVTPVVPDGTKELLNL